MRDGGEVLIFTLESRDLDTERHAAGREQRQAELPDHRLTDDRRTAGTQRIRMHGIERGNFVGEEPAVAFGRAAGNVETVLDGDRQAINN